MTPWFGKKSPLDGHLLMAERLVFMKTRKVNEITASLGIALLLSVSAAFLGITLGKHLPFMNALPLLFFPVGGFILICTVSRPAAKAFLHRHGGTPLRERRALMRQHLEDCKADPTAALSRYRFILVAPILLSLAAFSLALPSHVLLVVVPLRVCSFFWS